MLKIDNNTLNIEGKRLGYKKTKLGWIPKNWEILRISQLFTFLKTNSFSRKELEYSEEINGVRNIHYGDIHSNYDSGILDCTNQNLIPKVKKQVKINSNHEFLIDGDLIIADASEDYEGVGAAIELINVGKLKILSGLHTIALRGLKSNTAIGFRSYILLHEKVKHELKRIATGTKVYGISKYNIQKLSLVIPTVTEQKAIAKCLSNWDIAITKQTQLIAVKKELKKALMQHLLTGKKRLPRFDREWSTNRFDHFLEYTPRPFDKPDVSFTKLGIRSHCKGTFQHKNFEPEKIAIDTLYLVKPKDLIVNITFAWEGAVAIVKDEDEGALVSHRFPTYTFIEEISDSDFFEQFIQSKRFRYLLELISPGGAGRNRVLSKKELNKLKIKIPSYKEQKAIGKVLKSADQEIELLNKQLEQLKEQKKGLMQQLLTGKKRLKF